MAPQALRPPADCSVGERRSRWLALVLALACLPQVLRMLLSVPVMVPLDFNEGWNALQVQALRDGLPLYPGTQAFFDNNYPPLSFAVVALAQALVGEPVIAGRVVATLSFFALAFFVGLTARRLDEAAGAPATQARASGWLATALCLAVFLSRSHYPGINDPQMLGHAVALGGLAVLARDPANTRRLAGAALLMALALWIKQSLVVLPAATLLWLVAQDRAAAARFAAWGVTACLAFWGLFEWIHGPGFLAHLLAPRIWSAELALRSGWRWLAPSLPQIAACMACFALFRPVAGLRLAAWMVVLGVGSGLYFVGGAGVDQNVFFDAYIAFALAGGLALSRLLAPRWGGHGAGGALLALALVAPVPVAALVQARADWLSAAHWLAPRHQEIAAVRQQVASIAANPGPAMCGEPALCLWAGKGRVVDPFGFGQRALLEPGRQEALTRRIRSREFGAIQGDTDAWDPAWVNAALQAGYRLDGAATPDRADQLPPSWLLLRP